MAWSINGRTFALQNLGRLSRQLSNQSPDLVSFINNGAAFDGTPLFAENSIITITNGEANWFTGRIIQVPRLGAAREESIMYRAAGPWHDLERLVFKQTWKLWNSGTSALTNQYKSRVVLGQDTDGTALSNGEVVAEIIQYAIARGINIAIGTISPAVDMPFDEALDITCAEAIRRVLRWTPDAVCWFDYSVSPPTFNCQRRSELSAVNVNINAGAPNAQIDIAGRTDLQVPSVVIRYEKNNTSNGIGYQSITVDKFPAAATGDELGSVNLTIPLAGSNLTMQSAAIVVEALPADLCDLTWWKSKVPELNDARITNLVIHDDYRAGVDTPGGTQYYANELISGSIFPWMSGASASGADYITVEIDYEQLFVTAGATHREIVKKLYTYKFIATNLTSKTYSRTDSFDAGEAVPAGIAQAFYNAVNPLQYEGRVVLIESEVGGSIGMGNVLNLTGGNVSAWTTMRAVIQGILEDVDSGTTTVSFGPAAHLGPADLIEMLRVNRGRSVSSGWKKRTTGLTIDAGSSVQEETLSASSSVSSEGGETKKQTFSDPGATYTAKITIDPAQVTAIKSNADVAVQAREIDVCVDGVAKKMIVVCSEPY